MKETLAPTIARLTSSRRRFERSSKGRLETAPRLRIVGLLLIWPSLYGMKPASSAAGRTFSLSQASNFTLEGKITQHSAGKLTVSTGENIVFHIRYDEKTDIKRQDGSPGSAKDFHIGSKVKVEGELTESGEVVAQKIEVHQNSDSKQR